MLIASCGRADALITAMAAADDLTLADSGGVLPPVYAAYAQAIQNPLAGSPQR